jgi:hypothetical protein
MSTKEHSPSIRDFETPADGYTILVTWPQYSAGQHKQDVWFAYLSEQAAAVQAVQNACGAMNDAKIEILGQASKDALLEHGLSKGAVKRAPPR